MYLESIAGEEMVLTARQGREQLLIQREPVIKPHVKYAVSQTTFCTAIFQALSLQQSRRLMAQAGATFHPHSLPGISQCCFMKI